MKLIDIEGIGPTHAATLERHDLLTTDDLLERGATPVGRSKLALASGISAKLILEWVNHADLCRIHGVASEYADLLEAAGVDTVPELAQRSAESLTAKLAQVNAAKKLVRRLPGGSEVQGWIDEAKTLPRVVQY